MLKLIIFLLLIPCIYSQNIDNILIELEEYAITLMEEQNVPGMAYAIVHDKEIIYAEGFGVKTQGQQDQVDIYTMFEIGSVSKAFVSTAIAKLADQGHLSWQDRVILHYPEFVMYDKWVQAEFRIEDLFAQRSGLEPHSLDMMPLLGFGRDKVINAIRHLKPITSFRNAFGYVNNLFLVGAKIVEAKSGLNWEDYLETEIFQPLSMHSTSAKQSDIEAYTNRASGHSPMDAEGNLWPIPHDWVYNRWLYTISPAGGICSNVIEMCNWMIFHLDKGNFNFDQIITPQNIDHVHNPFINVVISPFGRTASYCLAFIHESRAPVHVLWHNGQTFGMHSILTLIPKANMGIIVLTNSSENNLPALLSSKFYQLLFHPQEEMTLPLIKSPILKKLTQNIDLIPPEEKNSELNPNELTGRYINPAYGIARIYEGPEGLYLSIGERGSEISGPIIHYYQNSYYLPVTDWPGAYIIFHFIKEPGQQAEAIVVDLASDVNDGVFMRLF